MPKEPRLVPFYEEDAGTNPPEITVSIPQWLDNCLFAQLGAIHAPAGAARSFDHNLRSSKSEISVYLGTYFPRSLAEAFVVFDNLLSDKKYAECLSQQETIDICSVGTGTGGDLLGLILALENRILSLKKLNILSIGATMEDMRARTGFPEEQLVFNHRLPRKIARVAQYANREGDPLEDRCRNEGSENPYFLRYDSLESQLNAIKTIVETRELEDVGILLPDNDKVGFAANYLRNHGFPVEYKAGFDSNLNFTTSNPKVMTYHSAKGLQFEAVFLPGCETSAIDRGDGFNEPLYVAMTRTYRYLYIMYTQCLPDVLADVPGSLYSSTLERETELL